MNSNTSVLSVSHVSVMYQKNRVLHDICFSINRGACVGIVGPNGAGKSSLLKTIMEIIPRSNGTVSFFGAPLSKERKRIAYVSQRSSIDWDFPITVFEVALMGCYVHLGWFKRPCEKEKNATWQALQHVGMESYAHQPIGLLSGGQQQRVFLARALVQDADLYIMDEPFAGIDMATEHMMVALFKQLCAQGKTVIVVHHDLYSLDRYFDTLVVLNKSVVAYGTVSEVLQTDAVCVAYGRAMSCFPHHCLYRTPKENR